MGATQRELLEDRWSLLMRDVAVFADDPGGTIGTVNSKRCTRLMRTLEQLAASMVTEVWEHESTSLMTAVSDVLDYAEKRLIDWAEQTENARAERRAA